MKMRSQYIPEEARSTIMNFFRIPLNIFVCVVLYNVDAFPITVMFGMCSIFLFVASVLQRRLLVIADKPKTQDWAMKERDSEAEPLNIWSTKRWQTTNNSWLGWKTATWFVPHTVEVPVYLKCIQFIGEDQNVQEKDSGLTSKDEKRDGVQGHLQIVIFFGKLMMYPIL